MKCPAIYDSTYLSSDVNGDIIDEFGERLVTDALRRRAIRIRKTSHVLDAAPAAGQAAEVFAIPNGYPLLRRLYKITTTKPGVVVFGILQSPFDRLAYSLNVESDLKSGREEMITAYAHIRLPASSNFTKADPRSA